MARPALLADMVRKWRPPDKTEFLLDGISINEQLFDGVVLRPSVDAILEFKVQSNSFSAEYGRGNAVVNATIKSGTNQVHGTLFEFLRNDALDARNFFLAKKAPYRQNQFGFALGGPVVLPKFNGRNKSFFFLNYEGTRIRQGRTSNVLVPSEAFRRGDFSSISTIIKDPLTGTPFPGNIIPQNRINPATAYFQQFMPAQNTATGTFAYAAPFKNDQNQGNARYDHIFSASDSMSVRYSINHLEAFNPGSYPQNGGSNQRQRVQNLVASETHIFSPTVVNELRLGYTRMHNANLNQGLGTNYTGQSGIGGFEFTSQNFPGFPNLSITGFQGIAGNSFQPLVNPTNSYELVESVSIIRVRTPSRSERICETIGSPPQIRRIPAVRSPSTEPTRGMLMPTISPDTQRPEAAVSREIFWTLRNPLSLLCAGRLEDCAEPHRQYWSSLRIESSANGDARAIGPL